MYQTDCMMLPMNNNRPVIDPRATSPNSSFFSVTRYFLLTIVASLSYPITFSFLYESSTEVIICSLVHAVFSALVVYRVVSKTLMRNRSNISMATIFILINLLYLNVSSIKYFEPELYPGFVTDNWIRLLFSLLALLVLWVTFEIVKRYQQAHSVSVFSIDHAGLLRILITVICVLIAYSIWDAYHKGVMSLYLSPQDLRNLGTEQSDMSFMEKLKGALFGSLLGFLPILLALNFRKKWGWLFIISGFVIAFVYSVVYGTRVSLAVFIFGLIISMVRLHGIGKRYFVYTVILAPLIICISSFTLMPLTKRTSLIDKEFIRFQLAYRFDLTDFAATLIQNHEFSVNYQVLTDAIVYSIPKVFLTDKYDVIANAYDAQLEERNLRPMIDYTDTFFSIGGQLFGIIGFILVPFLMVMLLVIIERGIYSLFGKAANVIIISCIPLYIRVENDLNGLFTDWRMLPTYIFWGLIVYWVFIRASQTLVLNRTDQP